MAVRSCWKGFVRLSLVTVPVKAYTAAATGGGDIHLNQLHAQCHSRIHYKKVCPIHGEVSPDDIVSGYEYAKGRYVVIDPSELDKFRSAADKAITIHTFIAPQALDPVYQTDKSYYLVPDGPVGQKPLYVHLLGS
jgi:DNA end-binding protein Ku